MTPTRRWWMKAAIATAAFATAMFFATTALAFLSPTPDAVTPMRLRVTSIDSLPSDGSPQFFLLRISAHDAWTRHCDQTVGWVFLRKINSSPGVMALSTTHQSRIFRTTVSYDAGLRIFQSPCLKDIAFDLDGRLIDPERGDRRIMAQDMETYCVQVERGEVYIDYPPVPLNERRP